MPDPDLSTPSDDGFSWDRWLFDGLKAARRTLFRHDFGLPDEFWQHMEAAAHEVLAAARILFKTILRRRGGAKGSSQERRGPIDIEWE